MLYHCTQVEVEEFQWRGVALCNSFFLVCYSTAINEYFKLHEHAFSRCVIYTICVYRFTSYLAPRIHSSKAFSSAASASSRSFCLSAASIGSFAIVRLIMSFTEVVDVAVVETLSS